MIDLVREYGRFYFKIEQMNVRDVLGIFEPNVMKTIDARNFITYER